MKILLDIDNVICGFGEYFVEYLNLRYKKSYSFSDFTVWDFVWSDHVDLTIDQFYKAFDEFQQVGMWNSLKIYEEAKNVINELYKDHDVAYLTSRPIGAMRATSDYFSHNKLPFTYCKELEGEEEEIKPGTIAFCPGLNKGKIGSFNQIDIAVEDQPKTIQCYIDCGVNVTRRLQPYNEHLEFKDPEGFLSSCSDLNQFKELVNKA